MQIASKIQAALHHRRIHPRRWFRGVLSYSRYLGYIKPDLLQSTEQEFRVHRQLMTKGWEPRELKAPVGRCILALSPHADDETIGAGGLLLAHRDIAQIHLICLTDGAGGGSLADNGCDPKTLVQARKAEFQKTARELHAASVHQLDLQDGSIPSSGEAEERLRSIVSGIQPDVVILPWFLDGHVDHRTANILYARACGNIEALVLGYEIWSMLEPNAVFDITSLLTSKLALIGNYETQLRTVDYLNYASGLAMVRGYQAALKPLRSGAAEAFVALPNDEYCDLVLQLYGASDATARVK